MLKFNIELTLPAQQARWMEASETAVLLHISHRCPHASHVLHRKGSHNVRKQP
jgi:hypothetical protein